MGQPNPKPAPHLKVLCQSEDRGVAFLMLDDKRVDAFEVYDRLDLNEASALRVAAECWVDKKIIKRQYHGWDKGELLGKKYPNCFRFSVGKNRRFYGYLCHPKEPNDKRFWACVLVHHDTKNDWNTDEQCLKRVVQIRDQVGNLRWPDDKPKG